MAVPGSSRSGSLRDARWFCLLLAALVIVADRWSKLWIVKHVRPGAGIVVFKSFPHFFRITHVLNTGAAFSMFAESTTPETVRGFLIAFSTIAVIVVLVLIWKWGRTWSLTTFALALILGGAIGNMYDRIRFSSVVDFLEVHIGTYHWPDFNVADSAIVIGACLLLLESLLPRKGKG